LFHLSIQIKPAVQRQQSYPNFVHSITHHVIHQINRSSSSLRNIKEKEIASKEKIEKLKAETALKVAKTNKNKYDK
jgi:hypothetical protein